MFTGATATNPVNGEQIPIWIADYVLASYGTGAIMAVPAHDERDFEFAKKFGLPIVAGGRAGRRRRRASRARRSPATASNVNSGPLDGLPTPEAKKKITAELEARGVGKGAVSYRLRDWVFSRQRYWGEPIPIIHCPHGRRRAGARRRSCRCALPDVERYEPTGTGESPLAAIESLGQHDLPEVRRPGEARDQHDAAVGGLVLVLPALPRPEERRRARSIPTAEKQWMPVDLYVGGAEHAVLHLLYARFWHKVLYDIGAVTTKEPFQKLRHQGMVLAYSYEDAMGRYHELGEVELRGEEAGPQGDRREAEGHRSRRWRSRR